MRNIFVRGVLVSVILVCAAHAQTANDPYSGAHWYGALDYGYAETGGASLSGGSASIGYRFNQYFGLEAGDLFTVKSGVTINSGYIDTLALMPLGRHLSIFVSGGGAYTSDSTDTNYGTVSISDTGWRAGGGLEYRITKRIDFRAAYHYLGNNKFSNANIYSAGLAFRF